MIFSDYYYSLFITNATMIIKSLKIKLTFSLHRKLSKNAIFTNLQALTFDFRKFEQFLESQNSNFSDPKMVKKAIFEVHVLSKLISHKIEWSFLNFHNLSLNFTF